MKYRELGQTKLKVSEVGFSGWMINKGKPEDLAECRHAIITALDLGCTLFVTADVYSHGYSEQVIGQTLEQNRDKIILATSGGQDFSNPEEIVLNFSPSYISSAVEASLNRLKSKKVDLYFLHHPPKDILENSEEIIGVLEDLKKQGKIGYWGVSVLDPEEEGRLALELPGISAIQVSYNILDQRAKYLIDAARQKGIGVISSEPLAWGILAGKVDPEVIHMASVRMAFPLVYIQAMKEKINEFRLVLENSGRTLPQAALRYVLDNKSVSSCIAAGKLAKHVEEDMAVSELKSLTGEEIKKINGAFLG